MITMATQKLDKFVSLTSASKQTYLSDIVELSALENINRANGRYLKTPIEKIYNNPPDYLIVITPGGANSIDVDKLTKQVSSLEKTKIISIQNKDAVIPGVKMIELMRDLYDQLKN